MKATNSNWIPRKGKVQEWLADRTLSLGLHEQIKQVVPSVRGQTMEDKQKKGLNIEYKDLTLAVKTLGLSGIREAYEQNGISVEMPQEEAEVLALCRKWTPSALETLYKAIMDGDYCDPWWDGENDPTNRFRKAVRIKFALKDRHFIPTVDRKSAAEFFRIQRHAYNALNLDDIPTAARGVGVSLRWLLCVGEKDPFYTEDDAAGENVYDAMKLLPLDRQDLIKRILEEGGGE